MSSDHRRNRRPDDRMTQPGSPAIGRADVTPEPEPASEPTTPTADREPVQTADHPGGCYIKDGVPVNAHGEPIAGYVAIDGVVYRTARLVSHADV